MTDPLLLQLIHESSIHNLSGSSDFIQRYRCGQVHLQELLGILHPLLDRFTTDNHDLSHERSSGVPEMLVVEQRIVVHRLVNVLKLCALDLESMTQIRKAPKVGKVLVHKLVARASVEVDVEHFVQDMLVLAACDLLDYRCQVAAEELR